MRNMRVAVIVMLILSFLLWWSPLQIATTVLKTTAYTNLNPLATFTYTFTASTTLGTPLILAAEQNVLPILIAFAAFLTYACISYRGRRRRSRRTKGTS